MIEVVSLDTTSDGVFNAVGFDTNQSVTFDQARFVDYYPSDPTRA